MGLEIIDVNKTSEGVDYSNLEHKPWECTIIDDRNFCPKHERGECGTCELRPYLEKKFDIKFDD